MSSKDEVAALRAENASLRARLAAIDARKGKIEKAQKNLLRGGWRVFLPLLDRQKVVRSFSALMETAAGFGGPPEGWPTRDELLADTRVFLESVARFQIRRRTMLFLFGLLASAIPLLQVWLVVQQNEIIANQNDFFEIQVYDVVARSMTEGDRNARLMTGALLANARMDFLEQVVNEAFDPELVFNSDAVEGRERRVEDAAFRGHLIRAMARAIERGERERAWGDAHVYERVEGTVDRILDDAAYRMPELLTIGAAMPGIGDSEQGEQVDHYIIQVGNLLETSGRAARSAGREEDWFASARPFFARLSSRRITPSNAFAEPLQVMLQDLCFEVARRPSLGDPPVVPSDDPEALLRDGFQRLSQGVGGNVRWGPIRIMAGLSG
jgi:hypothetical protein